jgi:hypothetical protein
MYKMRLKNYKENIKKRKHKKMNIDKNKRRKWNYWGGK